MQKTILLLLGFLFAGSILHAMEDGWSFSGSASKFRKLAGIPISSDPNKNLRRAAKQKYLPRMKELLAQGADVNCRDKYGRTPLHYVCDMLTGLQYHEYVIDAVRFLFEHGADIDAADNTGRTPLHWAAYRFAPKDVIALLLQHKADH